MAKFQKNDAIQFVENHKWCGIYGTVVEEKKYDDDVRYMIGVPTFSDDGGIATAYIFSLESKQEFEYVGRAIMIVAGDNDE